MILEELSVVDFRVFQGKQTFDLQPRVKWGTKRPIVLFGGLNGAGKTSVLTAILVALYGRQALGHGTAQKSYDKFLKESIHKARNALIQSNTASVNLIFSFAQMGVVSRYEVQRSWTVQGKQVRESLKIVRDGHLLRDLTKDQAQAFLNELIPLGVSDLFFFDGEKIKELAEDKTGTALADAIKKLLGLDLIDRLQADLTVFQRNKEKTKGDAKLKQQISELEEKLEQLEQDANCHLEEYEQYYTSWIEGKKELDRLTSELDAQGGAWSKSRQDYLAKQAELSAEKKAIENEVRNLLADKYPLAVAPKFSKQVAKRLNEESEMRKRHEAAEILQESLSTFETKLKKTLKAQDKKAVKAIVDESFGELLEPKKIELRHELNDAQVARLHNAFEDSQEQKKAMKRVSKKLAKVSDELDQIGVAISRAPDERTLVSRFEELNKLSEDNNQIHVKMEAAKESRRRCLREAIEVTRKLKALHDSLADIDGAERSQRLADDAKGVLKSFQHEIKTAKVKRLEEEFIATFQRLARKEDVQISAKIDPKSFNVTLIDKEGNEINKNDLSAGEKQIYAISILEALARTSGRNLPVIIDTPLGRLDSKHRMNLVENYFPYASQQVIILSTDTEVDESFYNLLFKNTSHAFKLEYNPERGATIAQEGYFWRQAEEVA